MNYGTKRRRFLKFAKMEQFAVDIFIDTYKAGGIKNVYKTVGKRFKYQKPYKIACEAAAESWNYHDYAHNWYEDLGKYIHRGLGSYINHDDLQRARKEVEYETK
jgi:hypothetical protein